MNHCCVYKNEKNVMNKNDLFESNKIIINLNNRGLQDSGLKKFEKCLGNICEKKVKIKKYTFIYFYIF